MCKKKILIFIYLYSYIALVHPENQLCAFLNYSGVDAWRVIEIQGLCKILFSNSNYMSNCCYYLLYNKRTR